MFEILPATIVLKKTDLS